MKKVTRALRMTANIIDSAGNEEYLSIHGSAIELNSILLSIHDDVKENEELKEKIFNMKNVVVKKDEIIQKLQKSLNTLDEQLKKSFDEIEEYKKSYISNYRDIIPLCEDVYIYKDSIYIRSINSFHCYSLSDDIKAVGMDRLNNIKYRVKVETKEKHTLYFAYGMKKTAKRVKEIIMHRKLNATESQK
jgi:hypothetical protein